MNEAGLVSAEAVHPAPAHEDDVPAHAQAAGGDGRAGVHRLRAAECAGHGNGRAAGPGRGVDVIFGGADVLTEAVARPGERNAGGELRWHAWRH